MSNKGRPPNDDDMSLWGRFVQGIKPLHKKEGVDAPKPPKTQRQKQTSAPPISPAKPLPKHPIENQLDRATLNKLRKGKMPVEATLDLHGQNQDAAYQSLVGFVTRAFQSQKRCVLVITGKGARTKAEGFWSSKQDGVGVLKSRLPEWVASAPLNDMIIRSHAAHRNHGGDGAYYLYLKRNHPKI